MATNKNKKKLRAPKVADSELSRVVTDIYDELNKLSGGPSGATEQRINITTISQSDLPLNPVFQTVTADEFIGDLTGNVTGDVTGDLTGAIHVQGKNDTGGTLTKGTPVYISGQIAEGQQFTIGVADSDGSGTMPSIGILSADVNDNAMGDVVTHGKLIGIDTSSFTVGDELFIGSSGTLVNTPPTGESNLIQKIAKVIRVDASSGQIYIMGAGRTNAVPNLNEGKIFLGDSNNQAVASTFSIVNEVSPSGGGSLAYSNGTFTFTPADVSDLTGYIHTITTNNTSGLSSSETTGNVTISLDVASLTAETTINNTDEIAINQSGNTKKAALSSIDLSVFDNTTSGFITDYTVTESDVTAHQAALSISESQISPALDYDNYNYWTITVGATNQNITSESALTLTAGDNVSLEIDGANVTINSSLPAGAIDTITTDTNSGLSSSESSGEVTISLDLANLTEATTADSLDPIAILDGTTTKKITLGNLPLSAMDNTDSGFIDDYTVTQGDVTQHQAALSITESQISDLQTYLTAHPTIGGSAVSQDNSGNSFIQDLTFDTNGHVTAVTSATASFTDTNYYLNGADWATGTGVLTLNVQGTSDVTVNLDGRYLTALPSHNHNDLYYTESEVDGFLSGKDNYQSWTISDNASPTPNSEAITSGSTLKFEGSGATSVSYNASNNIMTITSTDTNTDTNNFVSAGTYNASTKDLTLTVTGQTDPVIDLTAIDADKLDGQEGSYYLDYTNFSNTPTLNFDNYDHWTISDGTNSGDIDTGATLTVAAGTGITTAYSSSTQTLTISSTLAGGDITAVNTATGSGLAGGTSTGEANLQISVLNLTDMTDDVVGSDDELIIRDSSETGNQTRRKAISEIKLSQFNNDSNFTSNAGDITEVTAGDGLSGGGTSGSVTVSHADTSSQASVDGSGGSIIQDVTLDDYGHVTSLGTTNLDNRYLTLSGGTLTGDTKLRGGDLFLDATAVNGTGNRRIRFTEGSSTSAGFQGGYIYYDGDANKLHLGMHDATDSDTANDLDAITILRSNQNVGIGTTSPEEDLHIEASSGGVLRLTDSSASDGGTIGKIQAATTTGTFFAGINFFLHDSDDGEIRFRQKVANTNTDTMTLVDGNVGIGTTPSHTLHVEGNIVATGSRIIDARYDSNNYMRMESNSSGGVLRGADGGVTTIFLRSYGDGYFRAGNFGLGTDSPSSPLTIDNSSASSGNTFELLGSAGNFYIDYTGRQIEFAPTTGNAIITSGSSDLEINASTTYINQDTEIDGTLYNLGNVGIGTTPSTVFGVNQLFSSTDSDVDNKFAYKIEGNFSGTDTTTADREQGGIYLDINSSADGDASNEHRLRGIWCDVRYSGFTDIAHSGYFYAESNNTTVSTSQLYGIETIAVHDGGGSGGVNTLAGSASRAYADDAGSLNYVAGAINQVQALSARGANNITTANPTWSELELGASFSGTITNHYGVRSALDNNSTAGATITNSYLFYGDIQGTDPATNKWGIYISSSDRENYFGGSLGIGTTPDNKLHVSDSNNTTPVRFEIGSNANYYFQANSTSGYATTFNMDDTGLDIGHNSSGRSLNLITNSTDRISISGGGDVTFYDVSQNPDFFWDRSAGNLGLGTNSPTYRLTLHEASSGTNYMQFTNTTTGTGGGNGVLIGLASSEDLLIYHYENENIRIYTAGQERLRVLNSGGLTFNADTATANALDDYEEGTWTPTINGSADNPDALIYDTDVRFGRYTKIGDTVHLWGRLRTDSLTWFTTSTNPIYIGGLPFDGADVIGNGTITFAGTVGYANNWNGDIPQYCAMTGGASDRIYLYYQASHGSSWSLINPDDTESSTDGNDIMFQITYKV